MGELVKVPELNQLASMAVSEAIALANAKGLAFGQDYIDKAEKVRNDIAASNPAWRTSLLQDLEAGRHWNLTPGAVARR